MSGQLEIPGYSYDPIKKRYFKLTPAQLQESKRKVKAEAHEARSKRSKARKKAHQKQSASRENRNPLEQKLDEQKQGLEKRLEQRRFRSPAWQRPAELRCLEGLALGRSSADDALLPDGLFVDETITALHVDDRKIRVGGSGGTLLHCDIPQYDERPEWYKDWVLNGPVTAIVKERDNFLASSLGPVASAILSPVDRAASLASTVFRPPKTSIWTCHLDVDSIALGGDQSLLLSTSNDPGIIKSISTKSAVFSLARQSNRLLAGTRSGNIFNVDPRMNYKEGKLPQKYLNLESSVLQMKTLKDWQMLVSSIDGTVNTYDLRAKPTPILSLKGHVNRHTRELGLDIWQDSVLAAAGSDKRIRLWSLDTGQQITSSASDRSLLGFDFPEPVKALGFQQGVPRPVLYVACGEGIFPFKVA